MKDRWKQRNPQGKTNRNQDRNRDRNAAQTITKEGATTTPIIIQEDKKPDLVNRLFCKTVTAKKPLDKISNGFFYGPETRNPKPETIQPICFGAVQKDTPVLFVPELE